MHRRSDAYSEDLDGSVLGIVPPDTRYETYKVAMPRGLVTEDAPSPVAYNATPPVPMYAPSITPSIRETESPFSHAPTPSSVSSYSSSMFAPSSLMSKIKTASPSKRRISFGSRTESTDDLSRLDPVREGSDSSSNKTLRPSDAASSSSKQSGLPKAASTVRKQPSRNKLTKERPTASASAATRIPPELAHLNVDNSQRPPTRSAPPSRPSREGTADLAAVDRPRPVVHSDLPRLYTGAHRRLPSQETPSTAGSSSLKSRLGFSPKVASSLDSPRVDSTISVSPLVRSRTHESTTSEAPTNERRLSRRDSPALERGTSPAKSSHFGFFSRKIKSDDARVLEKPQRAPTKGPVAGTGHEKYRRFGFRGRTASSSSSNAEIRSPSADSNSTTTSGSSSATRQGSSGKSTVGLDDFLRNRLKPVVLRGNGSTNAASAAPTTSDLPVTKPPHGWPSSPQGNLPIKPQLLPSAFQGFSESSWAKPSSLGRRASVDISDDDTSSSRRLSAAQRLSARLSRISRDSSMSGLSEIHRPRKEYSTEVNDDSRDSQSMSSHADSTKFSRKVDAHHRESLWLKSGSIEPPRRLTRKYNFIQHVHAASNSKATVSPDGLKISLGTVPLTAVAPFSMSGTIKPVPLDEVERLLDSSETSRNDSGSEAAASGKSLSNGRRFQSSLPALFKAKSGRPSAATQLPPPKMDLRQGEASMAIKRSRVPLRDRREGEPSLKIDTQGLQPTPSRQLRTPEPQLQSSTKVGLNPANSPRPPRLSPIGRIPRVVSKRDRDRKLPETSFSRPFVNAQPRATAKPPGSVYTQIREMAGPVEAATQTPQSAMTPSQPPNQDPASKSSIQSRMTSARTSAEVTGNTDFLRFTPSFKGSEDTSSSSSERQNWYAATWEPPLQQDDIWNEYNDFLDEVLPDRPLTAGPLSSRTRGIRDTQTLPATLPPLTSAPPSTDLPQPPGNEIVSVILSVPQQVARFLQPSLSPMTPDALLSLVEEYGKRSTSTLRGASRLGDASMASTRRTSVASSSDSRASALSRSSSLPRSKSRASVGSFPVETRPKLESVDDISKATQNVRTSLRLGALMTSKWLSFGRILFSPAHHELQLAEDPRVLIVDGLGSDWSYYVAMAYKTATVYNLCPDLNAKLAHWPDATQPPPQNHFQIPFAGLTTPMPFPRGFFNAVVFRFPAIAPEESYRFFLSECKRVLRPGGFLEVAVLDLDLMNMGNHARKAVRDLKIRIQQRNLDYCLNNLSDVLVRLIGRRGFADVQRCIVGVPAVGRIPRSQDASSASSRSTSSTSRHHVSSDSQQFRFADLLDQPSSSAVDSADESLTKMVARVGRWWYASCYEQLPTTAADSRGIWRDRALRRECAARGTSFRMLVCHAQKPAQVQRRTVSL